MHLVERSYEVAEILLVVYLVMGVLGVVMKSFSLWLCLCFCRDYQVS